MEVFNHSFIEEYSKPVSNIRRFMMNYIMNNKLQSLVIGISGGIDSTLVAALSKPICDALNIPLIGRSITIETNKKDEIDRAREVGNLFCTDFQEMDYTALYKTMRETIIDKNTTDRDYDYKIACGNLKARIRMIQLYALAGINKGLVLSTDNYTEYLTGFWTLHGDVGDFSPIQYLWKTEVYKMSEYIINTEIKEENKKIAIQKCIDAVPTDGLGISNSDLDQLGVKTYLEADTFFQKYFDTVEFRTENEWKNLKMHPLIQRYNKTHFKRNNPYQITRNEILNK